MYTTAEKQTELLGFKGVDEVVISPWVITKAFMEEHSIDLVLAGSDYEDPVKIATWYGYPQSVGKYATFPRRKGISTSKLMRKVVNVAAKVIVAGSSNHEDDVAVVERFLALVDKHF